MPSLVDMAASRIAEQTAPQPSSPYVRWRWGTVVAVNSDGTMDVEVGGSTMPSVRALASAMTAQVGDRVRVDYLGTDAVVTGVRATAWRQLPDVETGSYTLPSNNYLPLGSGYKDYTISFSHTFRAVPNVQLTLAGGSTASEMCNVQVGVYAVTTTNFTARFWYQLTADGRQPTLLWLAVAT